MSIAKELKKIEKMRLNQDFSKAAEKLREILKEHPENFDVMWELAKVYFESGKEQTGVTTLRQILKLYPKSYNDINDLIEENWKLVKNPDPLVWFLWEIRILRRFFEEARKTISIMNKRDIKSQLSDYLQRIREIEKYKEKAQRDDSDLSYYYFAAILSMHLNKYEEAEILFQKILSTEPKEASDIKKYFQSEIDSHPKNPDNYLIASNLNLLDSNIGNMIDVFLEIVSKDKEEITPTIQKLEEIQKKYSENIEIMQGLAELYILDKDFSKALSWLIQILQANPGKTDQIVQKLDTIQKEQADLPELYLAYVDANLNDGEVENATKNIRIAMEKNKGISDEIFAYAQKIREKFPNDNNVRLLLVELFEKKEEPDSALELLRTLGEQEDEKWRQKSVDILLKIVKNDESNIDAHDLLAKIYIKEGQLERATAVYDHLWESHPESLPTVINGYEAILKSRPTLADVGISLAKAYTEDGNYQDAVVRLGDILKRNPKKIKEAAPLLRKVIENDRKQIYLVARLYESLSMKKKVQDDADMALAMAEAYVYEKQFDRASQQLQRVMALDPAKTEEVMKLYEKITESESKNIGARLDLVDLYIQEEKHDEATKELQNIIGEDESSLQEAIERFYKILDKEEDNSEARRALIKAFYEHNLIDHAAQECQKVLEKAPNDEENSYAYLILSDAYIEKGLFSDAVDKLFTVLNINPEVLDEIKEKCRKILKMDETNVSARYCLAECFIMEEDYDSSVEIMMEVLKYDKSRIDSIIAHINRIIKLKHTHVKSHLALGQLYIQKGEYDTAAREFTQALELDAARLDEVIKHQREILNLEPDSVIANFMLGKALVQKKNFSEAVKYLQTAHNLNARYTEPVMREYQRIVGIDPKNPEAKVALGKIFVGKGLYTHAIQHFSDVIREYPEREEEIISEYEKILKKAPNLANLHLALAEAYAVSGKLEEAVSRIEKVLEIDPKYIDEGIQLLEEIVSKDSSFAPALLLLADCYTKKGNFDEASTHFISVLNIGKENLAEVTKGLQHIISIKPDHMMSKIHLGDVYYQIGEYEKAKEEFETALQQTDSTQVRIELYLHLSNAYLSMGQEEKSKECLLEAKKLDPENQYLYRQLQNLYSRQLAINIENLNKILEEKPEDHPNRIELANLYRHNNEIGKAIKILGFSTEKRKLELKRLKELAICFIMEKDHYAAINVLSNVKIQHQNLQEMEKELLYWLAVAYENIGKLKNALEKLEQIYACDPNFKDVKRRKNRNYLEQTKKKSNILIESI